MPFQLHKDARTWFKKVLDQNPLPTLFDVYQLCFTLGIAAGRHEPIDEGGDDFMDEFIQRYRPYELLIIGAMLAESLDRQGVALTDRAEVVREIERLVDSKGVGLHLTQNGYRELNAYATGGFNYLREELEDPPNNMVYLLNRYHELMKKPRQPITI
jgi:hypothetical protein